MSGSEVSRRESEVLALVGESLTNAQIAERLVLSERTVESHVSSLLRKLGAADRRELARIAGRPPAPLSPGPAPRALPASLDAVVDPSTYVGRHDVRAVLDAQWRRAVAGATVGALVAGDAGMGKTRAVAEFAAEARDRGARVLAGACYQDVDAPFGPFVAAIEGDAATMTDEALRARGRSREVLGLLAPPLARALRLERSARRAQPDREAVLDALGDWVITDAREEPVLLVLEDLHWSTSSSRDGVRQLLRAPGGAPVLVVMTTRTAPGDLPSGFDGFVADLRRLPTLSEIVLEGLTVDEVATLTGAGPDDAARIRAESGGNPLLVTHAATAGGRGSALDAVLADREERLDALTRDVLDLAAVLGADFDLDDLVRAHGGDLDAVLVALETAEAAGLVIAPTEGSTRFTFVHVLIRDHRYGSLPWRRRLGLHACIATAMDGRDERSLSDHARHACLAVPVGPAAPAIDLARRAGDAAEAVNAFEEAEAHFRRAIGVVGALDPLDEGLARQLAVRLASARHHGGNPAGRGELLAAADDSRNAGDDTALVGAATSLSQFGVPLDPIGPDHQVAAVVQAALDVLDARPSAARAILELLLVQTGTFWESGDHQVLVDAATRCEAMARELGDPEVLAAVLLHAIHCHSFPTQCGELERLSIELEQLGLTSGRLTVRLLGIKALASAKRARGDLLGWRIESDRLESLLGTRPVPLVQLYVASDRSHHAFYAGDLDTAAARARAMGPIAAAVGHPPGIWVGAALTPVRRIRGEDARVIAPLQQAAVERAGVSSIQCVLAAALARSGDLVGARRSLDAFRRSGSRLPEEYAWSFSMGELAEAAELTGDAEVAAHVLRELGPHPGWFGQGGSTTGRQADETLAQAALATGELDAAEEHAGRAVDWARAQGTPIFLARSLVFLAQARRRGGMSTRAVGPLVDEALELAGRHGIRVAEVDIDRYGLRP